MQLTIEVEDVDKVHEKIKTKRVEIKVDLRDKPWGERHFVIEDSNRMGIDIVNYTQPLEN